MAAQRSSRRSASPDSLPEAVSPAAGQAFPKVDSFGLNAHHFQYEPAAFPLIAETRVGWVRLAAWWRIMQPQPGPIDFGYLDLSVDAARANGLRVLIVFGSIPGWANGTPTQLGIMDKNAALPPKKPQFFQDFVTAVVARYHGRVEAYEIWNEPNYKTFWNSTDYDLFIAEILIPGAQAVKAADPNAKAVGPATDKSPPKFKAAAIQACRFLDALSCHLYVPPDASELLKLLDDTYRPILASQCDKPLWVTELGFDSWVVGEAAQAKELVTALKGLGPQHPYLERLFLFHWRDGNWPYPGQKGWGLVGNVIEGYRRKKSFWIVQNLALKQLKLPGLASSPQPVDGATNVPLAAPLAWLAGRGALSHRVSFGPGSPAFQREVSDPTFPASGAPREHGRTYFWRVDEVGSGGTTTGSLWQFTVEEDPAAISPVIVRVQPSMPLFLGVSQGQGRAQCAPVQSLVLPGTPENLAKSAWTVATPATDFNFLFPAGKAPDPLTITLSGLRSGGTYRVFGRYATPVEQPASQAAIRMGFDPAAMTLYDAGTAGASVLRQDGSWEEREVLIGSARAGSGNLKIVLDAQGVKKLAGWSGLRLELTGP